MYEGQALHQETSPKRSNQACKVKQVFSTVSVFTEASRIHVLKTPNLCYYAVCVQRSFMSLLFLIICLGKHKLCTWKFKNVLKKIDVISFISVLLK